MNLHEDEYAFSRPDAVSVRVRIDWSIPATHDVLFSGLLAEDDTAFFYAIVALDEKYWWPYYIGKVFAQNASTRHRAADHIERLNQLRLRHPARLFHLTLGTPHFEDGFGGADEGTIDELESLLIYTNQSERMINKQKMAYFASARQSAIENTGFSQHLWRRSASGVFASSE
jgi:hypothetical protein